MLKVLLVRRADIDLPAHHGPPPGPPLNAAGLARAEWLAAVVRPAGVTAIYRSEYLRTAQTVTPLATQLGIPAQLPPTDLIPTLLRDPRDAVVLIAGHSNTV